MNVGLYGGSFDPPHLAHVMVPMHLMLNDDSIDRLLVIPCYGQPGKILQPFEHRFTMAVRAFEWLPRTFVTDVEARIAAESGSDVSLTHRLVRWYRERHPEWKLRWVMGADLMPHAPNWENWEYIEENAPPLVVGRAGITLPGSPPPITSSASSTLVREALGRRDYRSAERYLPKEVLSYIRAEGLYDMTEAT